MVRLVPEDEDPKRLGYEIEIRSECASFTGWSDFDFWFEDKVEWLFGLGLHVYDWPGRNSDKAIHAIEHFRMECDQGWYEEILSGIQTENP